MMTKMLIPSLLILAMFVGCGGEDAKNVGDLTQDLGDQVKELGKFGEEKVIIVAATKAMEILNSKIADADAPEQVTAALGVFAGAIEKVMPKISELAKSHPEWETNPPEELKGAMESLEAAQVTLDTETMPKVMGFVQQHAGDVDLQGALSKLQSMGGGM